MSKAELFALYRFLTKLMEAYETASPGWTSLCEARRLVTVEWAATHGELPDWETPAPESDDRLLLRWLIDGRSWYDTLDTDRIDGEEMWQIVGHCGESNFKLTLQEDAHGMPVLTDEARAMLLDSLGKRAQP